MPRHANSSITVNQRLGADVDAARRLIEQQYVDIMMQQPRDGDFLLIAAGQVADRLPRGSQADIQPVDPGPGALRPGFAGDGIAGSFDSARFSAMLKSSAKPSALAVLADHSDALRPPPSGRKRADMGGDAERSITERLKPEDRAKQFGSARADQAGNAQHLAASKFQRCRPRAIGAGQLAGLLKLLRSPFAASAGTGRARRVPTIMAIILSSGISAVSPPPTLLPSRRTVKRSHTARTSSRKWEM